MAGFDLSANVGALATHTIIRRRFTPGAIVDGRPGDATFTDLPLPAIVQPVPGAEAVRLALGERTKDAKTVFVASVDIVASDDILINGVAHGVVQSDDWTVAGGYSRSVCVRRTP